MAAQGPEVLKHHQQGNVCFTRPKYREGRRLRAVKVYTINLESRHLLVQGVPAVGVMKELIELFALYGTIEEYFVLHEYPAEEFTEVYHIKYQRLQSARIAKRKQDERSFFGSLLHVCYAPEFETVEDTREKLKERRRYIMRVTSNKDRDLYKAEKKVGKPDTFPNVTREASSENSEHCGSLEPNQQEWNTDSMTTQLHDRKKINQQMNINIFDGLDTDTTAVVIGPKLPEIPKVDMGDNSLNVSATLIRNKLTEVLSVSTTEAEVSQIKPPKQRRRI
ncbi:hypothetical protein scyTo_0015649 [Scyliorhinus torazame]|uniref:RNA-binding protein 48 n=1 Tax=Scyliorhinus torazame TaxID=75743 RepID=A0A401PW20_SCYTO|nr:hypothetical protein [Scyliorhinus torazame]